MREKLIEVLVMGWRYAENVYLDHDNDIIKTSMRDIQDACNLTEKEAKAVLDGADALGC